MMRRLGHLMSYLYTFDHMMLFRYTITAIQVMRLWNWSHEAEMDRIGLANRWRRCSHADRLTNCLRWM
jgi:hypothetical protein